MEEKMATVSQITANVVAIKDHSIDFQEKCLFYSRKLAKIAENNDQKNDPGSRK
jgi:hypothetical protein